MRTELAQLDEALKALRSAPNIEVFALDDPMLTRSVDIAAEPLELDPFDHAVLAATLVTAERLRDAGAADVSFRELDGDLQPWDRSGNARSPLRELYDTARVWVYRDFEMRAPVRPDGW